MNKFVIVICALLFTSLAVPAFADNPWEGVFSKAVKHADGTWTASVKIRATGVMMVKDFAECRAHQGGFECRNQIDGNSSQPAEVNVADTSHNDANSGNTTTYAVFHPTRYPRYVPQGRSNVWNLDSEPQMRSICGNAGGNCVIVEAPLHNWKAAVRIAKAQTNWPL